MGYCALFIYTLYESRPEFPTVTICNAKNIYHFYFNGKTSRNDLNHLVCYEFNKGKNSSGHVIPIKSSNGTGYALGLIAGLNNSYSEISLHINYHKKNSDESKKIFINTGSTQYIRLRRVMTKRLSYPYSNCQTEYSFRDKNYTEKDIIKERKFP